MNLAKIFAEARNKVVLKNANKEVIKIKSKIDKINSTDLFSLKGVGESTIKLLLENWISSIDELKEAWIRKIEKLSINPFSLKAIKEFLKNNK